MAILVLLECRVDRESVSPNNIHVIKYAVVYTSVRSAIFSHVVFFLGIYGQSMVGLYTTLAK